MILDSRTPRRVLIVIRQFFPLAAGAETQALRQARSYIAMGVAARVVTARHDATLPRLDTVEGVPVTRLPAPRARALGSILYLAGLAFYLVANARSYDAVLVFHLKQSAAVVSLVCAFLGKRVVVSAQSAGVMGDVQALSLTPLGSLILWCVKKAAAFVSGASEITDELAGAGIPLKRISFIPNGIPVETFAPSLDQQAARMRLGIAPGAFVAVNIGRHTAQKDLATVLEGWRRFAPAHPGALLLLVGDGDLRAEHEAFVAACGLGPSVRFEGWRDNVRDYLAAADVFVSASLFEGTHIALGEAMAAGLPVVATPVGGARDFVRDGVSGCIVPIGAAAEVARCLDRLAADPAVRDAMGRAARATAETELAQEETAQKHLVALFGAVPQRPRRRIRVTHLIATLDRGGSEQQMARLASGVDRRRFDCRVLCLTRGGPARDILDAAGVPLRVFGKTGKADPRAFLALCLDLFLNPPDVLHTWLFTSNSYGRVAGLLAGVPRLVASERSTDPWKGRAHRCLDRLLARFTDAIVANSRAVASSLAASGVPARCVLVIANSVDTDLFQPRDRRDARNALGLDTGGHLAGFIGRLAYEKRPEVFLDAAREVLSAVPDSAAVFFGTGPMETSLKSRAAESRTGMIFAGDCRRPELAHAALDCLALTSAWEGFPNVVLEAMASARPVVAVRMPATEELIEEGVTGFLVDDDPRAIAAAIVRVFRNPDLGHRVGRAAREYVEQRYSIAKMVSAYEALYAAFRENT